MSFSSSLSSLSHNAEDYSNNNSTQCLLKTTLTQNFHNDVHTHPYENNSFNIVENGDENDEKDEKENSIYAYASMFVDNNNNLVVSNKDKKQHSHDHTPEYEYTICESV
eukprot:Pgem_evm1s8132